MICIQFDRIHSRSIVFFVSLYLIYTSIYSHHQLWTKNRSGATQLQSLKQVH